MAAERDGKDAASTRAGKDEREDARRPARAPGTVRYITNFKNTIYDTFRYRGWKEAEKCVCALHMEKFAHSHACICQP